jgi:hypothetical protein
MAVMMLSPCFAAVEMYPRMAYLLAVAVSERSRPEIFCRVFAGRRSRSAWLEVGGIRRSVRIGFPAAGGPGQGEHLGPGQQFAGQGHDLPPDLVLGEAVEREVA